MENFGNEITAVHQYNTLITMKQSVVRCDNFCIEKRKNNRPMPVAEISNQHEKEYETKQTQIIGFRREAISRN